VSALVVRSLVVTLEVPLAVVVVATVAIPPELVVVVAGNVLLGVLVVVLDVDVGVLVVVVVVVGAVVVVVVVLLVVVVVVLPVVVVVHAAAVALTHVQVSNLPSFVLVGSQTTQPGSFICWIRHVVNEKGVRPGVQVPCQWLSLRSRVTSFGKSLKLTPVRSPVSMLCRRSMYCTVSLNSFRASKIWSIEPVRLRFDRLMLVTIMPPHISIEPVHCESQFWHPVAV
jgi:hypothetical protein